jgi:signal transduction histidine kinase/PAS domain-containing protein
MTMALNMLPRGGTLVARVRERHHRWLLAVLWLHVPGVAVVGSVVAHDPVHGLEAAGMVAVFAALAGLRRLPLRWRSVAVALGLSTASAALVHLSGGYIELHFHYFVVLGLVSLYRDWRPFMVTVGFVVLHHGLAGTLAPRDTFNHPAAWESPWVWALIHAAFVAALAVVLVVSWGVSEREHERHLAEQARAAAAVEESERRLSEAQTLAGIGTWEWRVESGELIWSLPQYHLYGQDPDSFRATLAGYLELVHPEDRAAVTQSLEACREHGTEFVSEHRVRRPDGSVFWSLGRARATRGPSGEVARVIGTNQDVTERRLANAAIRESESNLRLIQFATATANQASSLGDVFRTVMAAVCDHTGWPAAHAYVADGEGGPLFPSNVWHATGPGEYAPLRQATAQPLTAADHGLIQELRDSRERVWVVDAADPRVTCRQAALACGFRSVVIVPVMVDQELAAFLEFYTPADGRPSEALLGTLSQVGIQLGRVSERERAETALAAARDEALAASRATSDFLATMSHEIRTPLNGVIGLTGLLMSSDLDEGQRNYAGLVRSAGESLLEIVNDVLDYSKIRAGKLELEHSEFDLSALVEEVSGLVAETDRAGEVTVLTDCHERLPRLVRADGGRLRQVLFNLVGNAVKFTPPGGTVQVTVSPAAEQADHARQEPTPSVTFAVTDSGIGISRRAPAAHLRRIRPSRCIHHPYARGYGPRTRHLRPAGPPHGRRPRGRERGRPWQHLPVLAAVRDRGRRHRRHPGRTKRKPRSARASPRRAPRTDRRGQPGQPDRGRRARPQARLECRRSGQRPGSTGRSLPPSLRRSTDGLPDAGAGRFRGHATAT